MTNLGIESSGSSEGWDRHGELSRRLRELQGAGASEEEIRAVADKINQTVAELTDSDEDLALEDTWVLGAGDNPYLPDLETRDY